jgi:hypothetical protein
MYIGILLGTHYILHIRRIRVKIILEEKSLNETDTKAYYGMNLKTFSFISIISFDTAVEMDFANGSFRIFLRGQKIEYKIFNGLKAKKFTNRT